MICYISTQISVKISRILRYPTMNTLTNTHLGFQIWQGALHNRIMPTPHAHTAIELNFVISGWMRYFVGGKFCVIPENRLAVLWGGLPHQMMAHAPHAECIWVTIPLAWFLQWRLSGLQERLLIDGWLLFPKHNHQPQLTQWLKDTTDASAESTTIVLLEIEALFRRLARDLRLATRPTETGSGEISQFEHITRLIGEQYTEPIAITDLAQQMGLHPNYLMQIFKRQCGMSIWEYITRLRISHAQRQLLTTPKKILTIAYEAGFASPSRFYDAFAKFAGEQTPSQYRKSEKPSFV